MDVIAIIAFAGCLACAIWTTIMVSQLRADQETINAISKQLSENTESLKLALTPGPSKL